MPLRFLYANPSVISNVWKGAIETYLDKLCERRIRALLLLKLILSVQLMRAVGHKRGKQQHDVKEDIRDSFDHSVQLLKLVERIAQPGVDPDDVVNVPKHLLDEVCPPVFRDDIRRVKGGHPNLCSY